MNREQLLTVKQVTQVFGISAPAVSGLCKKGLIPFYKFGRTYLFDANEIAQWIDQTLKIVNQFQTFEELPAFVPLKKMLPGVSHPAERMHGRIHGNGGSIHVEDR